MDSNKCEHVGFAVWNKDSEVHEENREFDEKDGRSIEYC